jgi:putative hemin transport protein
LSHGLSRTQALRLAPSGLARRVDAEGSIRTALAWAASTAMSIMIFVGNPGILQIHSGPVHRIVRKGDWLNVLDPGFSLHLHEPGVDAARVVVKPTDHDSVTSLELFDACGDTVLMVFAKRQSEQPEPADWRRTIASL